QKYGREIMTQLKRLGVSCDWERERFTMDLGLSTAVREVFVRLWEEKLIYRDDYIVNWCPRCHTALSDLEVEREERNSEFVYIKYGPLVLGTVRPETKLGDTGIAVHPKDPRYQQYIGKTLSIASVEGMIDIKVVGDEAVDPEFGTGVVKVTPGHDPVDFEIGRRHNLPVRTVIGFDGRMTPLAGKYAGLDRFECRKKIIEEMKALDLIDRIEPYRHAVGICYRCRTVTEPLVSKQWFVKTKPLAEVAAEAVKKGKTKFTPKNWEKTYFEWMDNIRDWCISRQIWWGHQIPAWYCENKKCPVIVAREDPTACPHCGSSKIVRDEDVLDTWFSSALWPFSTLGWPEKTPELEKFYPTSLLVTGFDIIFFWIARMMMMGLKFMGEVPFREVAIHALVRDIHGQKMSKSKGNVIDPLTIMDQYGTDAFRFTLAALAAQGRDVKLSEKTVEGYRNFANKIWNAFRFAEMNMQGVPPQKISSFKEKDLGLYDRWILHQLDSLIEQVDHAYQEYHFDEAARLLYDFFWHTFCDWYLEFSKTALNAALLSSVLDNLLKMMHPIIPFLTEELWQKLGAEGESLMVASFPTPTKTGFEKESKQVATLQEIVTLIRTIRSENRINPSVMIPVILSSDQDQLFKSMGDEQEMICRLARVEKLTMTKERVNPKGMAHETGAHFDLYIPLQGLVDFESEQKRLEKEVAKLKKDLESLESRLARPDFVEHAPPEIVEQERRKKEEIVLKLTKFQETLQNIRSV
ncbi:MAG: valine--tRNA ligase, partial [Deltaproteobacteria bacterium]|nr:valine--tRNA ligase [Deltaproteobacteria bacterium]